jgi:pimeloyl-ACP methyl ester carboxylesterase
MTIMCLAAARPELFGDRVRGVALVSTSAGDLAPAGETLAERLQLKLAPGMVTVAIGGARAFERVRQVLPPTHPRHRKIVRELLYGADATDEMVIEGAEIMHATTVRAFAAFYPALGEHDKRQELKALAGVPVEILVGDSDKLTPERHSHQLVEVLPDATLQIAPRTGHMLLQERPGLVAEAIGRLLTAATADRAAG